MTITQQDVTALWKELRSRVDAGDRFAGLFATHPEGGTLVLSAHVAAAGGIDTLEAPHALPRHVAGYGIFTIPHGPVRSGVLESIEYLVETPGEAIPHLNMRVFYKHRGVENRFAGMTAADGVLLAERAEGIASVAHALAFSHAVETIAGCQPPPAAALIRVLYAELERIANHLDVAVRLADAAGLAVATARLALHKERVLRLVSRLCGSRFGRGVVVPAGVSAPPRLPPAGILTEVDTLRRAGDRRSGRADGHLLVPGPAARHRPASAAARTPARGARPGRQGRRVRRRRPARPSLRRVPVVGTCRPSAATPPVTPWPG